MHKFEKFLLDEVNKATESVRYGVKAYIKKAGDTPPVLVYLAYCPECKKISVNTAILNWDIRVVRMLFPVFLSETIEIGNSCINCGLPTYPLAYIFSSLAWIAKVDEELERYMEKEGTMQGFPGTKEALVTLVVTSLKAKFLITSTVKRDDKGNVTGFDKDRKAGDVHSFKFLVPLPEIKVDVNGKVLYLKDPSSREEVYRT